MNDLSKLRSLVGGTALAVARRGESMSAIELLTADTEGWPHVAWLSVGEVLLLDDVSLALCVWEHSTTSRNLAATGAALVHAVVAGEVGKWRLHFTALGQVEVPGRRLAAFRGQLVHGKVDAVPYAEVTGGPSFRLHEPTTEVIDRWKEQLGLLERLVTTPGGR